VSGDAATAWRATVRIRAADSAWGGWLEASLRPEAAREVPRARATLAAEPPHGLRLDIEARDAGALRAALNTYLGWVELAAGTLAAARAGPPPPR